MDRIKLLRRSRSPVLLDYDDFLILNLSSSISNNIGSLKNTLNLTQKAIGIHLNRLKRYDLIIIQKGTGKAFRERLVFPTSEGKRVFEIFKEAFKKGINKSSEFQQYYNARKVIQQK